jgi:hypothetical protein
MQRWRNVLATLRNVSSEKPWTLLRCRGSPAGSTVVGEVPAYQRVYLMDGSLLRDWVFIGKPGESGVSPRGWVVYSGLGQCQ